MKYSKFLAFICLASCFACTVERDYVEKVNPLQGTDSSHEVSTGNTYPAVAVPWGMNFWTPQTGEMGNGWQYVYKDTVIRGFKQTHQPSPWINDYGCFSLMPITGVLVVSEQERLSPFAHTEEISKPYYYQVNLQKYQILAEMTATNSGAIFQFTYPATDKAYLLVDAYNGGSYVKIIPEERKVIGYAKNNHSRLPDSFASYFVVQFDKDFTACGTWNNDTIDAKTENTGDHTGAYLRFKTKKGEVITAKVASSFISHEQAALNFDREVATKSFQEIKVETRNTWNKELNRVQVTGGTEEQQKTFYTALYRTMLFPRKLHEYDNNGAMIHYSAMNGKPAAGPMYTDNGFWDTFRAVHPYFTIMYPSMSGEIMQALVNYYNEGGWMPEWCSPGYRDCMIGQHSTSLICDAYMKGIRNFDLEKAWAAMEKGANNEGPVAAVGRDGCEFYNNLGYIPYNVGKKESVSKTLEYAYNDFCMARFASQTGKPDETVALYTKRAQNYRNIFDPSISFVRPKDKDGQWQTPYRPDTWGGSFTEGSAWHWTWCVYHDIQGLIDIMGGDKRFIQMLDSVFVAEPTFESSAYGGVIHEMTEMVLCKMGQYAHGNQPIQHAAYLFNHAGQPYKSQQWVRHIMDTQYNSSAAGLCGDEDNGQTSAWYVFSALGFYPVTPGQPEYVIGSPLFNKATLKLPSGKTFTVKTINNSPENIYIQSAKLNGKVFDRTFITHEEIINGGTLEFVMASTPNRKWGTSPEARPFSMSKKTIQGPTAYVDPYIGTGDHGHVFLGANVPFGMVQLGPVNITEGWDWVSGYHISDSTIFGFAHTHLSGTGIGDLCDIVFMPAVGQVKLGKGVISDPASGTYSLFSHDRETARAGYYAVHLDRYNIDVELTATNRVGFHKYVFPKSDDAKVIIDLKSKLNWDAPTDTYLLFENDTTVSGYRFSTGWANDQRVFFTATFSKPIKQFILSDGKQVGKGKELKANGVFGQALFNTQAGEEIYVKVALSPVSIENAKSNLQAELPGWNFEQTVRNADQAWNKELDKITIETDEETKRIFYTALYHTMIVPSEFCDVNGDYYGADKQIHRQAPFVNYTTFSLWDTYRAAHPLMTIIHPEKVSDIIQTMLAIYQQQGKLPVWHLTACETDCMVGNPAIPVVSDAILKGYTGFDRELAFEAMKQSAMLDERGLKYLKEYGYIPYDKEPEGLSKSMEYAIADWSLAQVAQQLGKTADHDYFLQRSKAYTHYFDRETGFVRGLSSDGKFRTPFNPFESVHRDNDYTEGNAWQYTWLVPHDVQGLVNLFGGKERFVQKLDSLFTVKGSLGENASPDISGLIGQYAHGNEPSHHILYLYPYVGQGWKTAEKVRQVMTELYHDRPSGLSGNEDAGQMSAWYVLSALGFYQVEPAGGKYIFGSPLIDRATIRVGNGKTFEIIAENNSADNKYIRSVSLNGHPYDKYYIDFKEIEKGGVLKFVMSNKH